MFIDVTGLRKSYTMGAVVTEVLRGLDLELEKSEIGVILGPSGSGKSTLVILAGFLIGVPVALASFGAVYGYVGDMINLVLPTVLSPLYVLICFVLIMLTYQLSKRLSAKNLDKISMSEAIKAGIE